MSRVLIVFTDPATTEAPALVCDDAGHTVDFATASEAAVAVIGRPFDLVVITAEEPVGPTRAIRTSGVEISIVVICPPVDEDIQRELNQLGVRGIVFRPYAMPTLRKLLGPHVPTAPEATEVLFEV